MPIPTPAPPVKYYVSMGGNLCETATGRVLEPNEVLRPNEVLALLLQRAQEIEKPIDRDAWREFYSQSARLSAENAEHWRERAEKAEAAIDAALDEHEATRVLKARISELNDQLTARAQEIEQVKAELAAKHDYACRMDALAEERAIEITRLKADAALVSRAQQQEQESEK